MSSPINVKQVNDAGAGEKEWISLNRFGEDNITLNAVVNGLATFTIEGTLVQLNRGQPLAAEDVFSITNLVDLTASTSANIEDTPLEAIRVNQTAGAGDVTLHVMQQGGA